MPVDLSDLSLPDPIIPDLPRGKAKPSDGSPRPQELTGRTAQTLDPWTTTRAGDPLLELEGWGWDGDGKYDDLIEVSEVLRASVKSAPASRPDEWRINTIAPFIRPEDRSYWDPTITQQLALSPYIQRRMAKTKADKEAFLREIAAGKRVAEACEGASIKAHTYARWRRDDPQFSARVDNIRAGLADDLTFTHDSFVSRRKYFFGYDTYAHHQLMNDAIEATPAGGVTLILLPPEAGKGLALDTPLPTPTGWTTMAAVEKGDFLLDDQGAPTRVLAVSRIHHRPCFEVTFSDGAAITTDDVHRWLTRTRRPQHQQSVKTTAEIAATVEAHGRPNHGIPVAQPLELPDADLPIAPYTLGAWLGDGASSSARITCCDPEILANIELDGHEIRPQKARVPTFGIGGLQATLRLNGLLHNKHIPPAYLRASFKQRLALLQGLMDTDGSCQSTRGGCEFTTTRPGLASDVLELMFTLGLKPRIHHGIATLNGEIVGPKWRIQVTPRHLPIFRLQRKLDRQLPFDAPGDRGDWRTITSVEPVESVPTKCIYVNSPSHLFLAGETFIVTHNTTFIEDFLSDRIAREPSDRILYVSDRAGEGSMAQKVLSTLKDRFTDPHVYDPNAPQARIAEFIARFGPFRDETEDRDKPWNANYIKVHKASGRRDYTFQACGWRSKVYGARADLLICDDIQSEESLGQTDQILRRLRKTFFTRARRGKVIIIGTRIGIGDVYERLIEEGVVSEGGLVLIPALDSDGNSYCPEMWSPEQLEATRQIVGDEAWTTAYMMAPQEAADATFPLELIETCFLPKLCGGSDALAGTDDGTWRRIAHLDPALGGGNALWVSAYNQHHFRPIDLFLDYKLARNEDIFSRIKEACRYRFDTLVVEKNAQQKGIARDDRLKDIAELFGFEIVEHQTGSNKWDPMWGIRSMATAFVRREFQIPQGDEWTIKRFKPFIDQLIAWRAGVSPKVQRQDTVLSMWFGWLHWQRERENFSTDTSSWTTRGTLWKPGDMGAGWGRGGWQRPTPRPKASAAGRY